MWNKKFAYVLNYLKIVKAMSRNNPRTHSPQKNKKTVLTTAAQFQSLYSRKVAETIITLRLPWFTKKGVSGIKQKEKVNTII